MEAGGLKGFFISISVLLLFSVLVSFIFFMYQENARVEGSISKRATPPSFVFDDVATDLSAISNLNVSASRTNSSLAILSQGSFASAPNASLYASYSSFLASAYSNSTNSNASLDSSRLSDNSAEVIFSNGLQLSYSYSGASKSAFLSSSGNDTGALAYDLNISIDRARDSYNPWASAPGGDLNVTLRISDRTGNLTSTVTLNRSSSNSFTVTYPLGQISIRAGKVGLVDGALEINPNGNVVDVSSYSSTALFPPGNLNSTIRYYWNAWLNYSQAGNVSKQDWVELGRA